MNVSVLYLTKSCILRNTSTIVECTDEAENFFFKHNIITRINKKIRVREKSFKKILNLIGSTKELGSNDTNKTDIFEFYYGHFAKNKIFIAIRDFINYIFMFFAITYAGKKNYECIFKFFMNSILFLNKIMRHKDKSVTVSSNIINHTDKTRGANYKENFLNADKTTIIELIETTRPVVQSVVYQPIYKEINASMPKSVTLTSKKQIACMCDKFCINKKCPCRRENEKCTVQLCVTLT